MNDPYILNVSCGYNHTLVLRSNLFKIFYLFYNKLDGKNGTEIIGYGKNDSGQRKLFFIFLFFFIYFYFYFFYFKIK